ncbi:hypothetical protein CV102_13285 [Natronococcus pandeyae]|uniref:Uncharacterized protein n=1 Tax=Natronococcus pandeyae TaxID=2055836 RepID=A0A8J8Q0H5_9EURY|nr:hypothetical protein [Natronococcus pandeyae]TYL38171.1 hypothetical protein CV102_13285 [Natronococcus pandeyae]
MPEVKNRFKISDESTDYLWLQVDQDQESGIEVPVPKESPNYDARIYEQLRDVDQSTTIKATLVSENEENTAWRVKSIQDIDGLSPASAAMI